MNIIEKLTARIEEYRTTNKNACKNYGTQQAAEKATATAAISAGLYFDEKQESARYIVFYIPSWNRWVGALDYTELLNRKTSRGGYLGAIKGFFTY